ncbi:hypothetical protein O0I10_008542 [Lichtheimia ornata]|uniref:Aminopeptidase P N-terminal domain-containing protein n=1 Tax=Lichtheimia ornata TaxID=688661 RepID=A0AAD7UYB0_9FUNG|nr:uncharacterized protein O0I10_008542 [Lichtheimia ornata]KAJ8655878.1 hypothetical protein O0I10_008542 [Lichtheimia ornata]
MSPLALETPSTYSCNNKLPTRQHCLKVKSLLKLSNDIDKNERAMIYMQGADHSMRDDTDVELEFRQESNFFYLTGVDEPGFHVMIDLQTDLVYLIPPTIPDTETVWKGAPDSTSELLKKYDVDVVMEESKFVTYLADTLKPTVIHMLDNAIDEKRQVERPTLLEGINCEISTNTMREALYEARLIKFPWEIDLIRQATYISSHAHMALMQATKTRHTTEKQLAAYFRWITACYGLDRQAYIPIVASGPRAATLHYTKNNMPLPEDALVLVDAGAECQCYSSDVTRTFPVSGTFSAEAKVIYNIVLAMQEAVLDRLAPGVMWTEMEDLAIQVLCNKLTEIGILVGTQEELIESGVPYAFYFHSLGHSVGLNVHDVGGRTMYHADHKLEYSPFLVDRPLESSMVITVEPGLYFNDTYLKIWTQFPEYQRFFNMDVLERYRSVGGIRIEDTVVITPDGHENLTLAPKTVEAIEALMSSKTKKPLQSNPTLSIPSSNNLIFSSLPNVLSLS